MIRTEKKFPLWAKLICDALLIGAFLLTFSYFHHVMPRKTVVVGMKTNITAPAVTEAPPPGTDTNGQTETEAPDTVVEEDDRYANKNVSVTVEKYTINKADDIITYYVADIRVKSALSIKTAFANDTYGVGYYERIRPMAKRNGAIVAVSGDFYGAFGSKEEIYNLVLRNGIIYSPLVSDGDVAVLYADGEFAVYSPEEVDLNELIERGAWQAWNFGPILVKSGEVPKKFNSTSYVNKKHPRCGIGYYEPGHYCFVVVDGRQDGYSTGATIAEFADIFASLGVTNAYNLDGGRSASMVMYGEYVNIPWGDSRPICDIIYVGEE